MLCLHVGLQFAEIPRLRVGAISTTRRDVCTKLSVGPFVCVISSAHAELCTGTYARIARDLITA